MMESIPEESEFVPQEKRSVPHMPILKGRSEGEVMQQSQEQGERNITQIRRMEKRPLRKNSQRALKKANVIKEKEKEKSTKARGKSRLATSMRAPELHEETVVPQTRSRSCSDTDMLPHLSGEYQTTASKGKKPATKEACVEEIHGGRMWLASNFGFVLYMYDGLTDLVRN